jgi:hypothetical protein
MMMLVVEGKGSELIGANSQVLTYGGLNEFF